jgi:hypothetical protein
MRAVSLGDPFGLGYEAIFDTSGNLDLSTIPTGSYINLGGTKVYILTVAITPNSTTTSAIAGSLAITSNATGRGSIFQSDGTYWQLLSNYRTHVLQSTEKTIATTGAVNFTVIAPFTGIITAIDFSAKDALAAHDSNYITFTGINKGQDGLGSTATLLVGDANTTKATGGTALAANAKRSLSLHGTAANLLVTQGDRVQVIATDTGTLANAVTESICEFRFQRTV